MSAPDQIVEDEVESRQVSRTRIYAIDARDIVANSNPRNPLSFQLQDLKYGAFQTPSDSVQTPLMQLARSDDRDERAEFVRLIEENDPELVVLAASLLNIGQLHPIRVRENGNKRFTVICGCRRTLAVLFAWASGASGVPVPRIDAVMVKPNALDAGIIADNENSCRLDPTSLERARNYQKMLNVDTSLTIETLAARLGISGQTLRTKLTLLELPPDQQNALLNGQITQTKALEIHHDSKRRGEDLQPGVLPKGPPPVGKAPRNYQKMRTKAEIKERAENTIDPTERATLAWVLGSDWRPSEEDLKEEQERVSRLEEALAEVGE